MPVAAPCGGAPPCSTIVMCMVAVEDGRPRSFAIWLTGTTRSPRYRRIPTRGPLASARKTSRAGPLPWVPSMWTLFRAIFCGFDSAFPAVFHQPFHDRHESISNSAIGEFEPHGDGALTFVLRYPGLIQQKLSASPTEEETGHDSGRGATNTQIEGPASSASFVIALAGCASPGAATPAGSGGQQVVQTAAAGAVCTNDKYNSAGVPKFDLKSATVGFAQSEKEANPFRIAETQSIKDEATARASTSSPRTPSPISTRRSATSSRWSTREPTP